MQIPLTDVAQFLALVVVVFISSFLMERTWLAAEEYVRAPETPYTDQISVIYHRGFVVWIIAGVAAAAFAAYVLPNPGDRFTLEASLSLSDVWQFMVVAAAYAAGWKAAQAALGGSAGNDVQTWEEAKAILSGQVMRYTAATAVVAGVVGAVLM